MVEQDDDDDKLISVELLRMSVRLMAAAILQELSAIGRNNGTLLDVACRPLTSANSYLCVCQINDSDVHIISTL